MSGDEPESYPPHHVLTKMILKLTTTDFGILAMLNFDFEEFRASQAKIVQRFIDNLPVWRDM